MSRKYTHILCFYAKRIANTMIPNSSVDVATIAFLLLGKTTLAVCVCAVRIHYVNRYRSNLAGTAAKRMAMGKRQSNANKIELILRTITWNLALINIFHAIGGLLPSRAPHSLEIPFHSALVSALDRSRTYDHDFASCRIGPSNSATTEFQFN